MISYVRDSILRFKSKAYRGGSGANFLQESILMAFIWKLLLSDRDFAAFSIHFWLKILF